MQINDAMYQALNKEGFTGPTLNDMTASWLKSEGAVGEEINDLWHLFWNVKLIDAGSYSDRMKLWLASEGHTQGHTDDAQLDYWQTRFNAP